MRFGWRNELDVGGGGFWKATCDGSDAWRMKEGGFMEREAKALVPAWIEKTACGLHQARKGGVGRAFEVEDLGVVGCF